MIEFNGQPTGKCKLFMQKREAEYGLLAYTGSMFLFGIPVIVRVYKFTSLDHLWFIGVLIPAIIISVALFTLPAFTQRGANVILPSRIMIYDDGRMECHSDTFHYVQRVDEVKQVIDWGDWYQIVFIPSSKNIRYICQKDLLSQGSLHDFEDLFQGKITRRNS